MRLLVTGSIRSAMIVSVFVASRLAAAQEPAFPKTVAPPSAAAAAPEVSFTMAPYGLITVNGTYLLGNSSNNPDVPEWAVAGPRAFYFTARQTRLGLRGSWVTPPSALHVERVEGLIEADFYGGFSGQGIGYVLPIPRLRLATATVEWRSVRFSFGQDWAVLAPLIPSTALHTAVPGFTSSGNLWARIPQLRVDGAIGLGDPSSKRSWRLLWTAAAVASVQADAIPSSESSFTSVRIPQGGERSLAPAGEARLAIAGDVFDKPAELGLSGHLGNRRFAFTGGTADRLNGAVALDVTLPLPGELSLRGEAYWGNGLDAFFGGIGQGVAFTTDTSGAITFIGDGIEDAGGWGQLSWAPRKWLTLYAGAGLDKPKTADLVAASAATNRTLNVAAYGEISVVLASGFALWLEYNFLHTEFQASPSRDTHVVSLSGQLTF